MLRRRHNLTQLTHAALLLSALSCDTAPAAVGDAGASASLCDGSDELRFAYQSGGGFVDIGYYFERPYGMQFLFIDGHCNFLMAAYDDAPGSVVRGQLSDELAAEVEQRLELKHLPAGVFLDNQSCPDAGGISLATATFYGDCSCGCDAGAPPALEHGLMAMRDVLDRVRVAGAAVSGPVEVAAIVLDSDFKTDTKAREWPFSWPATEVVNQSLSDTSVEPKLRVLEGADADTARSLRNAAQAQSNGDKHILLQSGSTLVQLYVRDHIEPELAEAIARFTTAADPRSLHPLTSCQGEPAQNVAFASPTVFGQHLYAPLESPPVCGLRICWDGELRESQPVVAPLRVVKQAKPRPCLSAAQTSFAVDLTPVVDAFHASYPGIPLAVNLSLAGWSGAALEVREQP